MSVENWLFNQANRLRERLGLSSRHRGDRIVILGRTGVGKTSLVHALLNRKLESSTHGIIIPQRWSVDGRTLSITDRSGEFLASRKKELQWDGVAATIVVVAGAQPVAEISAAIRSWLPLIPPESRRSLVATKADLPDSAPPEELARIGENFGFDKIFNVSARTNAGVQELREELLDSTRELREEVEEDAGQDEAVSIAVRTLAETLCELVAERPNFLERVEWRDLERTIAVALEAVGFSVELTPPAKDGGKDIGARCKVKGEAQTFYVELKHWRGDRVGLPQVTHFVEVNARSQTTGGLFIASSGYSRDVYQQLGEISKQHVRLAEREKIVSLCRYYVRRKYGVWCSLRPLPEIIFEETLQ